MNGYITLHSKQTTHMSISIRYYSVPYMPYRTDYENIFNQSQRFIDVIFSRAVVGGPLIAIYMLLSLTNCAFRTSFGFSFRYVHLMSILNRHPRAIIIIRIILKSPRNWGVILTPCNRLILNMHHRERGKAI